MADYGMKIPRSVLEKLYLEDRYSLQKIAEILGCSTWIVRRRITSYKIPRRSMAQARMKYRKYDFAGPNTLKAYMIGFRLGDLNVYMPTPTSETIVVRGSTTQQEQIDVIASLFQPYGKLRLFLGSESTQANCYLNRTFDFLLPKTEAIPNWIEGDILTSAAFVAGYLDAEANFIINQGKARLKVDSYDYTVLKWIARWLDGLGMNPKLRLIGKSGAKRYGQAGVYNADLWRLNINSAPALLRLILYIKPFIRHRTRLRNMVACELNIKERILKGSVKYSSHAY